MNVLILKPVFLNRKNINKIIVFILITLTSQYSYWKYLVTLNYLRNNLLES